MNIFNHLKHFSHSFEIVSFSTSLHPLVQKRLFSSSSFFLQNSPSNDSKDNSLNTNFVENFSFNQGLENSEPFDLQKELASVQPPPKPTQQQKPLSQFANQDNQKVKLLRDAPDLAKAKENCHQAYNLVENGHYIDAAELFQQGISILEKYLDPNEVVLAVQYNNLADTLRKVLQFFPHIAQNITSGHREVATLLGKAQRIIDLYPEDQFMIERGAIYNNLGLLNLQDIKNYKAALKYFEKSMEARQKLIDFAKKKNLKVTVSEVSCQKSISLNNISQCYLMLKQKLLALERIEEGVKLFEEHMYVVPKRSDLDVPELLIALSNQYGSTLYECDKKKEAMEQYKKTLELNTYKESRNGVETGEPIHPQQYATTLTHLGVAYYDAKMLEDAERMFRNALQILEAVLPETHMDIAHISSQLALIIKQQKDKKTDDRWAEAEALIKRAEQITSEHKKRSNMEK